MAEERKILAHVDLAVASSGNAQVIGRNGEIPIRDFFSRYLPYTLKAATGHFVSPKGFLSPQIDVMILDARYPLLASNADGSVLAMMHGVIATFEVKTRIATRDLRPMWENALTIARLAREVPSFVKNPFACLRSDAIAYRSATSLSTIEEAYIREASPGSTGLDTYLLRLPDSDQPPSGGLGAELHFEPVFDDAQPGEQLVEGHVPTCRLSHTPLSDIYYRLVQDGYYSLAARKWGPGDIGQHVMSYMTWATCSWKDYETLLTP